MNACMIKITSPKRRPFIENHLSLWLVLKFYRSWPNVMIDSESSDLATVENIKGGEKERDIINLSFAEGVEITGNVWQTRCFRSRFNLDKVWIFDMHQYWKMWLPKVNFLGLQNWVRNLKRTGFFKWIFVSLCFLFAARGEKSKFKLSQSSSFGLSELQHCWGSFE